MYSTVRGVYNDLILICKQYYEFVIDVEEVAEALGNKRVEQKNMCFWFAFEMYYLYASCSIKLYVVLIHRRLLH